MNLLCSVSDDLLGIHEKAQGVHVIEDWLFGGHDTALSDGATLFWVFVGVFVGLALLGWFKNQSAK
jgi:hypothetical protein